MKEIGDLKTEVLEVKVKERLEQVKKIVKFIEGLTDEVGKVISYNQGSAHTHIVKKVYGFRNFTFLADTGHSMMGGNDFHVWYHPGKKEIDTEQSNPVFSVYYQASVEECKVSVFDPNPKWQDALNKMIDRKEEIIAEAKKEEEDKEKQLELQREDKVKRQKLLERVKELKL
jgi:hypothetical protein